MKRMELCSIAEKLSTKIRSSLLENSGAVTSGNLQLSSIRLPAGWRRHWDPVRAPLSITGLIQA
jgi:hypothetical protein